MKPYIHAENSVKKWGGKIEDYLKIHQWFDQTKSHFGDSRHRAILHSSFGIFLAESFFGINITNSDGKLISVRDLGEQHVFEDLGFIPSISDYLSNLTYKNWMGGSERNKNTIIIKDNTIEELKKDIEELKKKSINPIYPIPWPKDEPIPPVPNNPIWYDRIID